MKVLITLIVFLTCSLPSNAYVANTSLSKSVKDEILRQIEDILTMTNFYLNIPDIDTKSKKFCTLSAHVHGKMSSLSSLIKGTIYMWEDQSGTVIFDLSRHSGVLGGYGAITNPCEIDSAKLPAYFDRVVNRLNIIKNVVLSEY